MWGSESSVWVKMGLGFRVVISLGLKAYRCGTLGHEEGFHVDTKA